MFVFILFTYIFMNIENLLKKTHAHYLCVLKNNGSQFITFGGDWIEIMSKNNCVDILFVIISFSSHRDRMFLFVRT